MRLSLIPWLWRWHQRVGVLACVGVVLWGLSGLGHPIISRLGPQGATPMATALPLASVMPLAAVLNSNGVSEVQRARLLNWAGEPWYRIEHDGVVSFFAADSGKRHAVGDADYAAWLAQQFVAPGDARPVSAVTPQWQFDDGYLPINRLLPVYRVDFAGDEGLRAYVDTASGRLGALLDERKAVTSYWFRQLHSWLFIDNADLRHTLMTVFLLAVFATALAGLTQYLLQRRAGRLRSAAATTLKWHRRVGAAVALFALMFSASGLFHLWHGAEAELNTPAPTASIAASRLNVDWSAVALPAAITAAELVSVDGQPWWRLQTTAAPAHAAAHHHHADNAQAGTGAPYIHASTGMGADVGEEQHARLLAEHYSGLPAHQIAAVERIERFSGEYGFINKRLPVYAVRYATPGEPAYYVEPRSGVLASRVDNSDRLEGFSFAYLHKWHFLDAFGRNARDAAAAAAVFGVVIAFGLGWWMYLFGKRRGAGA